MKIEKLLEINHDIDKDYILQKTERGCKYLLMVLKNEGFEELAFLEGEQLVVSNIINYANKYINKYGTTPYISHFLNIFTPEFLDKIKDYNNHLE